MKGMLSTCQKILQGITKVYTRDGFPITVNWILAYRLDPKSIDPVMQASMAGILLSNPTRMAELQTVHCLEKIVGQYSLKVLRRNGIQEKVNGCTTRSVVDCLAAYGIVVSEIKIGFVQWPQNHGLDTQGTVLERLGEDDLSQMAELRPDQLNHSSVNPSTVQPAPGFSSQDPTEIKSQEISYYDAMAWDAYQHTENQKDQTPGKLVV